MGSCHCRMCRKWSGGPFFATDCGTNVSFEGKENMCIYDSSDWAERGFCNKCGSHLFYRLKKNNKYFLPIGLFDNDTNFTFDHEIFFDEKPHYYKFSDKTKHMTGAEIFAQFAAL